MSIGLAPGTAASAITMPLLQTVRNELPEVMVYLQESSGTALNDKLLAGQLDMAVLMSVRRWQASSASRC